MRKQSTPQRRRGCRPGCLVGIFSVFLVALGTVMLLNFKELPALWNQIILKRLPEVETVSYTLPPEQAPEAEPEPLSIGEPPFELACRSYYLLDLNTGSELWEHNGYDKAYPASLTKIMTSLLLIENVDDLDATEITVPERVTERFVGSADTIIFVQPGEVYTARQLLELMMLPSANDAAATVADYLAGSDENFAMLMNKRAAEIGAVSTHYANPHGLHDDDHYSTARDLALIAMTALQYADFDSTVREITAEQPATDWRDARTISSTCAPQYPDSPYYCEGVYGVKTGYTDEAGRCYLSCAERDGQKLLLVVMGANPEAEWNEAFRDTAKIYDWAFGQLNNA